MGKNYFRNPPKNANKLIQAQAKIYSTITITVLIAVATAVDQFVYVRQRKSIQNKND